MPNSSILLRLQRELLIICVFPKSTPVLHPSSFGRCFGSVKCGEIPPNALPLPPRGTVPFIDVAKLAPGPKSCALASLRAPEDQVPSGLACHLHLCSLVGIVTQARLPPSAAEFPADGFSPAGPPGAQNAASGPPGLPWRNSSHIHDVPG